jgi:hypothetical protein
VVSLFRGRFDLGEMMTYASFALMVWHWLPFLVLAWIWGELFAVSMKLHLLALSNKYAVRLIGPPLLARANITPNQDTRAKQI